MGVGSEEVTARRWQWLRRGVQALLGGLALLLGATLLLAFWPMRLPRLTSTPHPTRTFSEAIARARKTVELTSPTLQPECRGEVMHHGRRTARVFVLMHGLSNCPAQFRALGKLLFQRGYNVVLPRQPFHGEKNRLTEYWKAITAQGMLESASEAIDVAHGLGAKVTVVGLSTNGTVAGWLAQNRSDLDEVVLLAPFFAPKGLPAWALAPATRLILRLPNQFRWWDAQQKDGGGNGYSYPRFPTHAVGQVMAMSLQVLQAAQTTAPKCGRILVVTTASDTTADPALTETLIGRWLFHRPNSIRTYEFPQYQRVDHDFIDPTSPTQQVKLVYPQLLKLFDTSQTPIRHTHTGSF